MDPLYWGPEDDEPSWWLHVKCRNEHLRKTFAADMAALGGRAAELAKDKASRPVVDLEETRALSGLAASTGEVAGNLQRAEAIRAELVRRGIDPDKFIREALMAITSPPDITGQ
jgi:hypothetical protein